MTRVLKIAGFVVTITLATSVGGAWWYATSPPPSAHLQLPSPLIDAGAPEGRSLLESTPLRTDYDLLSKQFVTQSRRGYCGVASATMVVNALRPASVPVSQQTFFTARTSAVRSSWQVTLAGMTLDQLADLLRAHDLTVALVHTSQSDLETFRSAARTSLLDPSDFLLVNYDRVALHQHGSGHISPVVAYHAATDRFLILDVASYNYPPTWVPAADLWNAMNTVDASSGKSRGFVLVRAAR